MPLSGRGWTIATLAAAMLLLTAAPRANAQTRPDDTAGMSAAEARIARADYATLSRRYGVKEKTVRAIAGSVGMRNPNVSDARLLEIVAALVAEAGELRESVADLQLRVAALEDPAIRDPAIAALGRAGVALDEGRLEDAQNEFGKVRQLRWGESNGALKSWSDAAEAEAGIAQLRGDADLAEKLRLNAAETYRTKVREAQLGAWGMDLAAANGRYFEARVYGRRSAYERAIALFRTRVLDDVPKEQFPIEWGSTQINLGAVLSRLGERVEGEEGLVLLDQAIEAYRAALTVFTAKEQPMDWGVVQNNLGFALRLRAGLTRGKQGAPFLRQALAAFRASLTVRTREKAPIQWAGTQDNIGATLRALSTETENDGDAMVLLDQALEASRAALAAYSREDQPGDWGTTHINIGQTLIAMDDRVGGDGAPTRVDEAIAAFRAALTVASPEDSPADCADTQIELGNALLRRGLRTAGPDALPFLNQAAEAYRAAITSPSLVNAPMKLARTQGNLGNVLLTTGQRLGGSAAIPLFHQAITAFDATLTVFTESEASGAWVSTQNNLAVAREALADLGQSPRENLLIAESTLAGAVRVIDAEDLSNYRPMIVGLLARVRVKLAALSK